MSGASRANFNIFCVHHRLLYFNIKNSGNVNAGYEIFYVYRQRVAGRLAWITEALKGDWLFAPPTLRTQMIGAGCVTFVNRMSLLIQAHPELTTDPAVVRGWMDRWVEGVQSQVAQCQI